MKSRSNMLEKNVKICSQGSRETRLLFVLVTLVLMVILISRVECIKRTQYHEQVSSDRQSHSKKFECFH